MRSSLVVVLVALLACKGNEAKPIESDPGSSGSAAPTDDPFDKGLVELEAIRGRMCACNDVPCTEKVWEEFKQWRVDIRKRNSGRRASKEQEQKGISIDKAMRACRSNVTAKPGSAAGSANPIVAALGELDAFKSKMCACKDKACADAVQTDYATWQRNLRSKMVDKPDKPDKDQEARTKQLEAEMADCRKKAETGTAGTAGGGEKIDAVLAQMQGFRDKLCACTTKDCGDKIQVERAAWLDKVAKDLADAKPTTDQDAKSKRLAEEMKTCLGKLP